ncbi:MAG: glycosyltransferase family 4 protein [Sulfuritalea sp.]|nr:glycosyltransferase family 4 protein [Sulfuritalea sp.]
MKCILVTAGQGAATDVSLVNLRRWWRPLYAVEVFINALAIAWMFRSSNSSRGNWDIFHVHGAANLAPLLAAVITKHPIIWHMHEALPELSPLAKIGAWLVKSSRHTKLSVSEKSAQELGLPSMPIIPCPVDTEFWQPAPGSDCFKDKERGAAIEILAIGNLNPIKGMDLLLRSMLSVPHPMHLRIVGALLDTHSAYFLQLKSLAGELAVRRSDVLVEFLGWCDSESIRGLLDASDLFVLPSLNETGPIVLFEAMAMAKVCVAADVGAVSRTLGNMQQSLIFRPNDCVQLSSALKRAMSLSSVERRKMGFANREQIRLLHSPEKIGSQMLQAYANVLHERTFSTQVAR